MTRAKRRAKPTADFSKKRQKLGARPAPTNATRTTFQTRKIHVPAITTTTPQETLSRTRHHNPKTRTTAWNTLTNHLTHATHPATPPAVLLAAVAHAIVDDHPTVRAAAYRLLAAVLTIHNTLFVRAVDAMLRAALTHIRPPIRVAAAQALVNLPPAALPHPPLDLLGDLVSAGGPGRMAALAALAAFCDTPPGAEGQRERGCASRRRFLYHRPDAPVTHNAIMHDLEEDVRAVLIDRVAESVQELLQSRGRGINTACEALAGVVGHALPSLNDTSVRRVLRTWDYTGETYPLALVALAAGERTMVTEYMRVMLARERYVDRFDAVVRRCVVEKDVAHAFGQRFRRGVQHADYGFVKRACRTVVAVLRGAHVEYVLSDVPDAVHLLRPGDEDLACLLVGAACNAWRGCRDVAIAHALLRTCISPLVDDVINDIIGVALCASVLTVDCTIPLLGECARKGRAPVVDRVLDALDWLASRGEDRIKALALARALGRVVEQPGADGVKQIEAVV